MTLDQGLAFGILGATVALFLWGRIAYELVALLALLAGVLVGIIPVDRAFSGFADDVVVIVAAALPRLEETGLKHHVLVVDDGSPDGTGAIADRLASADPRVEVLHRTSKDGIGPAYLAGFCHALSGGADLLMEMDSDFSHDPADLPRLVAAAGRADIALGSRLAHRGAARPRPASCMLDG